MMRALVKLLRPHQWSKNLLVLTPVVVAHEWGRLDAWAAGMLGVLAFCAAASSTYVLNDWLDRGGDRRHPDKCARPFASGELGLPVVVLGVPLLVLLAFAIAQAINPPFILSLLAYLALAWSYCFVLRGWLWMDALALSGLYTLRVVAGALAIGVVPSPWLLGFSIFLFFSLAAVKRQQELATPGTEGSQRAYRAGDAPVVIATGLATGVAAVVVLALYLNSDDMARLYTRPSWLWLLCPLLLFWLARTWTLAARGDLHADPVVFALRDATSWAVALLGLTFVILAT